MLRQALRLSLTALLLGGAASWAASRWLAGLLFQVSAHDPLTYLLVPLFLLSAALMASLRPAWRASRLDPNQTLRWE